MKNRSTHPKALAVACVIAALTSTGLSACGKFEVDPKAKGVSTSSDPLKAEAEDRLRDLVSSPPSPEPAGSESASPAAGGSEATDETRDAALDQARRLFEEELRNGGPAVADAPATAPAPAIAPAPAQQDPATAPAQQAPTAAQAPTAIQAEPAVPALAPAPVPAQAAQSAALAAKEIRDEDKGNVLLQLVEPTMRINFVLSKQRNEILALKKILDEKKELSKEQEAKLVAFKRSFLLVPEDSMDALLSRVDTIAFSIMVAPLLLETNWGQNGAISNQALSTRVQRLNTLPVDDAVRFRSGRLAVKGKNLSDESRQIYLAEIGYNPEAGKVETLEQLRLTHMEVERVMKLAGISTMLDNRIKEISERLVKEATSK